MTYTPYVWHDGATGGTLVTAALLNHAEQGIATAQATADAAAAAGAFVAAPPPSGGDDTAVLQALLNTAQATGGTVILQAGTYTANLATTQSFNQPRILGQGKRQTTLQGQVSTAPALRFKGGSGQLSGGYFADLTITNPGGISVEIADANGVNWDRVKITGCAQGLVFSNEAGFSEFNAGEAEFTSSVTLAVHYRLNGGTAESFHGSGLTAGSVINQPAAATGPVILIDAGCFPYQAPLDVTIFARTSRSNLIRNNSTTRTAQFNGTLNLELLPTGGVATTGVTVVDTASPRQVALIGSIAALGGSGLSYGSLLPTDHVYYSDTVTSVYRKQVSLETTVGTTATVVANLNGGVGNLVSVRLIGANYYYDYLLYVVQDRYSPGGWVSVLANPRALNTSGWGAPVFAVANYQLTAANAAYPAGAVTATVTLNPVAFNQDL